MGEATIKLVNHADRPDQWRQGLSREIQTLINECLDGSGTKATVSWGRGTHADNLVLHFVQDVEHSYIQANLPGDALKSHIAGHTRTSKGITGSEFYFMSGSPGDRGQRKYIGYAKVALHEALHNLFPGWTEKEMHGNAGGGGLAAATPQLPPTDRNKELFKRGFSVKNKQLL